MIYVIIDSEHETKLEITKLGKKCLISIHGEYEDEEYQTVLVDINQLFDIIGALHEVKKRIEREGK